MSAQVRLARPYEAEAVVEVLSEAAQWARERGVHPWPDHFPLDVVEHGIDRAEIAIAIGGGSVIGTLALEWRDPLIWAGRADAGFVHRLAVARAAARRGIGIELLDWAETQVLARGRRYLRLDCSTSNAGLRLFYERAGFRHVDDILVRFTDSSDTGGVVSYEASRYERVCRGGSETSGSVGVAT